MKIFEKSKPCGVLGESEMLAGEMLFNELSNGVGRSNEDAFCGCGHGEVKNFLECFAD